MSASSLITLRKFDPADAGACLSLFRNTIHRVNIRNYSAEQIHAWAPLNVEVPNWASRFTGRFAYVACQNELVVGFGDMTTEGHLDRLFVSADHQRQGIARLDTKPRAMPGTNNLIAFNGAARQCAAIMGTDVFDGVELAAKIEYGNLNTFHIEHPVLAGL